MRLCHPRWLALVVGLALAAASLGSAARAENGAGNGAARDTSAATPAAPSPASSTGARSATSRASTAAKSTRSAVGAPRTLQEIQIEGEIPVPQVLFIRASDQRRFMDFHHRRYLGSSLEVGERTILPSGIGVTGVPKTQP